MLEFWEISTEIAMVLAILLFTTVLFISNVVRVDVVALLVLVILGVTKLLTPEQLFSGFSSEAVISLIAVMIISAGLENTGISLKAARWMLKLGKNHPNRISLMLMLITGLLASFLRSLGTVALFLPIVSRISSRTGISKSELLMPMAFCGILGGMLTMVGTGPLIVLNSLLQNVNEFVTLDDSISLQPFGLFSVFPIGMMMLLGGTAYLFLIKGKLNRSERSKGFSSGTTKAHFKRVYNKGGDVFELKVNRDSLLVGATIKDAELKLDRNLSVIALYQNNDYLLPPLRKTVIKPNSVIGILGDKTEVSKFATDNKLTLLPRLNIFSEILHPVRSGLSEAVIPPSSKFIGKDVRDLHMRRNHDTQVLALCRGNNIYHNDQFKNLTLRSGDTLGMFCKWDSLSEFQKNPDFFVLTTTFPREKIYPQKMPHALLFFLLGIGLVIIGYLPISIGLFFAACGMIATGVISIDDAYDSVSWKTVFLLAGLIPLGLVLQTTGTAEWLTNHILFGRTEVSQWAVLCSLMLLSTCFALILSNIGATVLLVPISIDLALAVGGDPHLYALTVALAASNTFIIPTHQVNALVAGTGGYSIGDFVKVGGWMTIIFWIILVTGIKLFYL